MIAGRTFRLWLVTWCVLAGWCFSAAAQDLQPVPPLSAHVVDRTGTLDAGQRTGLEEKLSAFERTKGTQIAFLLVATTQPEDIASYANRVGNAWKIGRKGVGDGVLLIVAKNDRKVRIEVAKTLEGAIPDLAAQHIIDQVITPNFKKGDFAGGLQAAADQIIARVSGEALPEPKQASDSRGKGFDWIDTAIFLFFAVPIASVVLRRMLGNKLGALATGAGVGTIALLVTSSIVIAVIAAFAALLLSIFSRSIPSTATGLPGRRTGWGAGPWTTGGGGWTGGGSWGGSGGGGDFGGGGASGDW